MKKNLTRILLLVAALVLALGMAAHAEDVAAPEAEAVSTTAYIFWQDSDWWPAVSEKEDDYWAPTPAVVTGEGYYTASVTAHMPSWFYSGGNHNTGAQKLALIVKDGADLFPGMFLQITDIRINGESYPCQDVTYGQTGYDNINDQEGGKVYWDANDAYALIYDQWMLDNGGSIETGATWNSSATAQNFNAFDVSLLNDPSSIEIDFFLAAQQDVKPAGGPALREKSTAPATATDIVTVADMTEVPENATTARLEFIDYGYWPVTDGSLGDSTEALITGVGNYTCSVRFFDQGGWTPSGGFDFDLGVDAQGKKETNEGMKLFLVVADGGQNGEEDNYSIPDTTVAGKYLGVSEIRINGEAVPIGTAAFGPTGYNDEWNHFFDRNDGYSILDKYDYDGYVSDGSLPWGHKTWDGSDGTSDVVDLSAVGTIHTIDVDFFVTDEEGKLPEPPVLELEYTYYPNNTMGVAGLSLRDMGIGSKWINVVPVNLTEDGIYKIPLVASNAFIIGNAIVTVSGDDVTVTYETVYASPGNLNINSECVKWFKSIDEITADFTNNPTSDIAFGQTVSKAELGDVAYLYINNGVSYVQPVNDTGIYLGRYWEDLAEWQEYRAGLEALMAPAAEEVPAE